MQLNTRIMRYITYYLLLLMLGISFSTISQIQLDKLPFDLKEYRIVDTITTGQKKSPYLILKVYSNNSRINRSLVVLYQRKIGNFYQLKSLNEQLIPMIHHKIESIDDSTFVVVNNPSKLDWNSYYAFFGYSKVKKAWFLVRQEVYRRYYNSRDTPEQKKLIRTISYERNSFPFEKANCHLLFGDMIESVYGKFVKHAKVVVSKAVIYNEALQPTKQYFIKGDSAAIKKEGDDYVKFYYYGTPKTSKLNFVEGWLRKEDIEVHGPVRKERSYANLRGKVYLYDNQKKITEQYLTKVDSPEIIEEEGSFYKIIYYTNGASPQKIVAWIKKADVSTIMGAY